MQKQQELSSQETIQNIQLLIQKIDLEMSKAPQQAILLIGDTGDGKTTLLNLLAQNKLIATKNKASLVLVYQVIQSVNIGKIGHSKTSQSFLPVVWKKFIDFPGFNDTRGPTYQICNAYTIFKLSKMAKKMKIVLVAKQAKFLDSRLLEFRTLLQNLTKTYPNINKLINSLAIVITKSKQITQQQELRQNFQYLYEEFEQQLKKKTISHQVLKVIECIFKDQIEQNLCKIPISFFKSPSKVKQMPTLQQRQLILRSIQKNQFTQNLKPNLTLSPKALLVLKKQFSSIKENTCNLIQNDGISVMQQFVKYKIMGQTESSSNLRKFLKEEIITYISERYSPQKHANNQTLDGNQIVVQLIGFSQRKAHYLHNILRFRNLINKLRNKVPEKQVQQIKLGIKMSQFLQKFDKQIQKIKFIQTINSNDKEFFVQNYWLESLDKFVNQFQGLTQIKEQHCDNGRLVLKGSFLDAIQINQVLETYKQKITSLQIFTYNTFLINENIQLNGLNVVVISPVWRVLGQRTICLQGKQGQDNNILLQKAPKQSLGEDGLPGQPGSSGGNFYGQGRQFINIGNLRINVSGGKGGSGQDGGEGGDGTQGQKQKSQNKIKQFDQKCLKSRQLVKWNKNAKNIAMTFLTINSQYQQVFQAFQEGTQGKNGGKGGIGGNGGKAGKAQIFIVQNGKKKQFNDFELVQESGKQGQNGMPGKGGKGGQNGPLMRAPMFRNIPIKTQKEHATQQALLNVAPLVQTGVGFGIAAIGVKAAKFFGVNSLRTTAEMAVIGVGAVGALAGLAVGIVGSIIKANIPGKWKQPIHQKIAKGDNGSAKDGGQTEQLNSQKLKLSISLQHQIDKQNVLSKWKEHLQNLERKKSRFVINLYGE